MLQPINALIFHPFVFLIRRQCKVVVIFEKFHYFCKLKYASSFEVVRIYRGFARRNYSLCLFPAVKVIFIICQRSG